MSVTVETTEQGFDPLSETSHRCVQEGTFDPEDRAVMCLVASQLAFCDAIEPLREFASSGASILPAAAPGENQATTTETTTRTAPGTAPGEESTSSYRAIAQATLEFVQESVPLRTRIVNAAAPEEIVAVLRRFGLDRVAARVDYLHQLQEEDPDEPLMLLDSLRAMALFLVSEQQLVCPQIGIDGDGLAQVEWRLPGDGILAMEFLPTRRNSLRGGVSRNRAGQRYACEESSHGRRPAVHQSHRVQE